MDNPPRKPPQLSVRSEDLCPRWNKRTRLKTNATTMKRTTRTETMASPPDSKERRVKGIMSTSNRVLNFIDHTPKPIQGFMRDFDMRMIHVESA